METVRHKNADSRQRACLQTRRWANDLITAHPLLVTRLDEKGVGIASTRLVEELMRFLWLCANNRGAITPSRCVDIAWHEFILFTRAYSSFCDQTLGVYVHHEPSDGPEVGQYHATLRHYADTFGPPDPECWPQPGTPSECGACETVSVS